MKPGSRLILNEFAVQEPGEWDSLNWERQVRAVDLQMMVAVNAKERTLEDWKALMSEGSGGKLRLESSKHNTHSFVYEP